MTSVVCAACGSELMSAERDPLVGTDVGNYRVLQRLGVGGMGSVYAAVEKSIEKKVAIKIVHPHLQKIAALPTLLAEARAVNQISDRGVVDVHGFGELPDGRQYLVMELLTGESLDALLRKKRQLDLAELVHIGSGILSALESAHVAGYVHRDIKPANVFVVRPPRGEAYVKLLDFGLAQRARTANEVALGTPAYVAPEQAVSGGSVGPAADLYAVGVVLFELAVGQVPFPDPDPGATLHAHMTAPRPHLRSSRPELPAALDALVVSLMAIDPAERPASAAAARAALEATDPKPRSKAGFAVAAALGVALVAAGWAFTRPPRGATALPGPDPLELLADHTAQEVKQALDERQWALAYRRLAAAERSFPGRKEWLALRSDAKKRVDIVLGVALAAGQVDEAEALAAIEPPPALDPAALALDRARFARKNGMVWADGAWVDAYEYPNRAGAVPTTAIDWADAQKLCQKAGKRLCSEDEWQRACAGPKGREFPYGDDLDLDRCHHKGKVKAALPAGALAGCTTPTGVHDLSGNVAEWTSTAVREGAPQRVIRGGSFQQSNTQLGCAARDYYLPGLGGAKHIGFRCCL